jgi:hypothetical protein
MKAIKAEMSAAAEPIERRKQYELDHAFHSHSAVRSVPSATWLRASMMSIARRKIAS